MKYLVFAMIFTAEVFASSTYANFGTRILSDLENYKDPVRKAKVIKGIQAAYGYAKNAYAQTKKSKYKRIAEKLDGIHFVIATNDDDEHCFGGQADASAQCPGNSLSLCVSLIDSSMDNLTSVIIHETAHATGTCDECQAEYITVDVMKLNNITYTNIGYPDCFR